ncbi:MAG: right-handed parallel beta-helix repeat-containing protein [Phycisphaerae bacterium]|nr:right-handed parallel beta-helix repeat-containing protein [Phycisphaerae bacterium]
MKSNHGRSCWSRRILGFLGVIMNLSAVSANTTGNYSVRDYGAKGDGQTLDTLAVNQAIEACVQAGGGRVVLTPGRYLCGTVYLKSHVTLYLEAGATLVGTPDLTQYQQAAPPDTMPEANWGKWHRALILAEGAEAIAIAGPGVIDGNKVFDPTGEERMRGPHTFVFVDCNDVTVRDVTFIDSANYAVFFMVSHHVNIQNVTFIGGWDGVHFRGSPEEDCQDVQIVDCRFYTGDDAIAGRYWDRTLISDCIINSSCNGIRLIGPARHLIIHDCLFYGPGVRPHITQNRTNMLGGIVLQPGAWDATQGDMDDVLISDVTMHNVTTPFHFSLKPGNTAGRITVDRVTATGVYRAAASVESWAETPFKQVIFRDVTLEYEGGGGLPDKSSDVRAPGVDARGLPAWGLYARGVQDLRLDNVRLRFEKDDLRPVLICEDVDRLGLDDVVFSQPEKAVETIALHDVGSVECHRVDFSVKEPAYVNLSLAENKAVVAGQSFVVKVTVQNGDQAALCPVDLTLADKTIRRWVWLTPNQHKEILFSGLVLPVEGPCTVRAGSCELGLNVTSR